jgi:hypothetical protein
MTSNGALNGRVWDDKDRFQILYTTRQDVNKIANFDCFYSNATTAPHDA